MTNDYNAAFKTADLKLHDDGVLVITLHSRGKSLGWNGLPHRELPEVFARVGADRSIRAVVLTGTGDRFIDLIAEFEVGIAQGHATAAMMDDGLFEGNRLLDHLLAIEVPVIAAVNGPVNVHAELALLSDIVICSEDTYFQDVAHVPSGLVPGDGVQVVWPLLIGFNRARYFLLTGEKIHAQEAQRLGLVSEVHPTENVLPRALVHARRLAACNPVFIRNTRLLFTSQLRQALTLEVSRGLALEAVASLSGADWDGPYAPEPIETSGPTAGRP
jgi:enoyl-CoA hydratase/carnithine racemase